MSTLDELLLRLQRGDDSAMAEMMPHLTSLTARVHSDLTRDPLRRQFGADDLLQECCVLLHKNAYRFDPEKGSAGTWIYQICRNLVAAAGRKKSRRMYAHQLTDYAAAQVRPKEEDSRPERIADVEGMGLLSDAQRDLLQLWARGVPYKVMAEMCGVSIGTIKSRIGSIWGRIGLRRVESPAR